MARILLATCVIGIGTRPLGVWGRPGGGSRQVGRRKKVFVKKAVVAFFNTLVNRTLGREGSQYPKPLEASYTHTPQKGLRAWN